MSRIGKVPVKVTDGVTVTINDRVVTAKGKKGELTVSLSESVNVKYDDNKVTISPANNTQEARQKWGLSRTLVSNIIEGVSNGFSKKLEINGVGYRAQAQGKMLKLNLGFSHDVDYAIPEGITIATPKPTEIEISGINKQQVGQVAAEIRRYRKPEPYKGKGVKYEGEYIRRKEGKKK